MGIPKALCRRPVRMGSLIAAGAAGVAVHGCAGQERQEEATVSATSQAIEASTVAFKVAVPAGLTGLDVVLGASGSLKIADRVKTVTLSGSPAQVSNTGSGQSEVGVDAVVGSLTSQGGVFLRNRAKVQGNLRTGATVTTQQGATVTGRTEQRATLTPYTTVSWNVDFGNRAGGDVTVSPDQSKTLTPGSYGAVSVYARSTLRLSTGTYAFSSLAFESGGKIELDDSFGWVGIYVRSSMSYRGTITTVRGGEPALFMGYAGTNAVTIDTPLHGTFVAPFATINLASVSSGHFGAVFAKSIEAYPDSRITQSPYPYWTSQPRGPTGDTGAGERKTLDDLLTGSSVGPEVRAFLTAGYTSLGLAPSQAAAQALRAKRSEVLTAVSAAFDPEGSFVDKRCLVSAAAALAHVEAVPFLNRALWAVPPTLDETRLDPHDPRFAGEGVVLGYALNGLRTIAQAGHVEGQNAIYQAALTHPLTGVRARAVYFLNHLFGEDAAAKALLKSRLAPKDVWMTGIVAGQALGTGTVGANAVPGPRTEPNLAIKPLLDCVEKVNATTWRAHFGYTNPSYYAVSLEVGNNNRFDTAPADRSQPTTFDSGVHHEVFTVQFNGTPITWSVQGNAVSASSSSVACEGGVIIK